MPKKVARKVSEVRLHPKKKVNTAPLLVYLGLGGLILLFVLYIISFFTAKPELNMMKATPSDQVIKGDSVNATVNTTKDTNTLNVQ